MKIVKFKGGMGNQMFQYAFLRNLQEVCGCEDVKADFSYYDCVDDEIRIPRIRKLNAIYENTTEQELHQFFLLSHKGSPFSLKYKILIGAEAVMNQNYYFEPNRAYRPIKDLMKYIYYDGYWQSWRYLEPIKDSLRKELRPKEELSEKSRAYMEYYSSCNSVFVGVRRGDYMGSKKIIAHFGDADMDYYKKAIAVMKERIDNPVFVFFSNDIKWVKENMNYNNLGLDKEQIIFRENDDIVDDFEELYVMASCREAIITNSTFNFWGAWLMENPDKVVIAPRDWFKDGKPIDIVPDDWIKL